MHKLKKRYECPNNYSLYETCHAHGWKNLSPFHWHEDEIKLIFSVTLGSTSIDISTIQNDAEIEATITSQNSVGNNESELDRIIERILSLDVDTDDLLNVAENNGKEYKKLVQNGAGRLLRSPTLWEDAAKTLFTTNCSWSLTKRMCKNMCSNHFSKPAPSGLFPFPLPETLLKNSTKKIQKLASVGYRANFLLKLAENFQKDPGFHSIETNGLGYNQADSFVRNLPGFGDYAVAHLLLMAGYYNEIPIDSGVVSYLRENYRVRKPKSFLNRKYQKWGKYKWWGYKLEKMINNQNWIGD